MHFTFNLFSYFIFIIIMFKDNHGKSLCVCVFCLEKNTKEYGKIKYL